MSPKTQWRQQDARWNSQQDDGWWQTTDERSGPQASDRQRCDQDWKRSNNQQDDNAWWQTSGGHSQPQASYEQWWDQEQEEKWAHATAQGKAAKEVSAETAAAEQEVPPTDDTPEHQEEPTSMSSSHLYTRVRVSQATKEVSRSRKDKEGVPGQGRRGGHGQDMAQMRRDLGRSELLIAKLRSRITELECELKIRDIAGMAAAKLAEQQQAHTKEVLELKEGLKVQAEKVVTSGQKVETLRQQIGGQAQLTEARLINQLEEHKKLQEQQQALAARNALLLEQKLATYIAQALDSKARIEELTGEIDREKKGARQAYKEKEDMKKQIGKLEDTIHETKDEKDKYKRLVSELEATLKKEKSSGSDGQAKGGQQVKTDDKNMAKNMAKAKGCEQTTSKDKIDKTQTPKTEKLQKSGKSAEVEKLEKLQKDFSQAEKAVPDKQQKIQETRPKKVQLQVEESKKRAFHEAKKKEEELSGVVVRKKQHKQAG